MLMKIFRKRLKIVTVLLVALLFGSGGLAAREALANGESCNPCIDLIKTGPSTACSGDTIRYTFTVKNCGNVPLVSGAYVYDPMFQSDPIWSGDLEPGQEVTFYRSYTVPADECGELCNTAHAVGIPDADIPACSGVPDATDTDGHTVTVNCECECPGTGTPGYWKNHSEAWPVSSIAIGGVTYSKEDAIEIMQTAGNGDKTYTMFKALVAAKLNVLLGCDSSCIDSTITLADNWMALYGPVGSDVRGSSYAWSVGERLYYKLDKYNNGLLCVPHRD